jgi:hypothetical protein
LIKFLHLLMRGYANSYVALLSAFFIGIAFLATESKTKIVNLPMFPWTGDELIQWLFGLGAFGILSALLNVTGIFRYLLPVAALVWAVLLFRGYFWLSYSHGGDEPFYWAVALTAGAAGAFLCGLREVLPKRK